MTWKIKSFFLISKFKTCRFSFQKFKQVSVMNEGVDVINNFKIA